MIVNQVIGLLIALAVILVNILIIRKRHYLLHHTKVVVHFYKNGQNLSKNLINEAKAKANFKQNKLNESNLLEIAVGVVLIILSLIEIYTYFIAIPSLTILVIDGLVLICSGISLDTTTKEFN